MWAGVLSLECRCKGVEVGSRYQELCVGEDLNTFLSYKKKIKIRQNKTKCIIESAL